MNKYTQAAKEEVKSLTLVTVEAFLDGIITSKEFNTTGTEAFAQAQARLMAGLEHKLELQGIDPDKPLVLGPTPAEREAKLREDGYVEDADRLAEAITANVSDDGAAHEKALEAQAAVNLEIGKQMADAAAKRAERNE